MPLAVIGGVLGRVARRDGGGRGCCWSGCAALLLCRARDLGAMPATGSAGCATAGGAPTRTAPGSGLLSVLRGLPLCGPPMLAMLVAPGGLVTDGGDRRIDALDRITEGRRPLLVAGGYAATAATVLLCPKGSGMTTIAQSMSQIGFAPVYVVLNREQKDQAARPARTISSPSRRRRSAARR